MRTNPRDWRIEDLRVVAERFSIDYRQHQEFGDPIPKPSHGTSASGQWRQRG
jgi:hypothetical protein